MGAEARRLDRNGIPILDPPGRRVERAEWVGPKRWQAPMRPRRTVPLHALIDVALPTVGVCWLCGLPIRSAERSADHIIPRSLGGTDRKTNLLPAHAKCNVIRGNRIVASCARTRRVLVLEPDGWVPWGWCSR